MIPIYIRACVVEHIVNGVGVWSYIQLYVVERINFDDKILYRFLLNPENLCCKMNSIIICDRAYED